MLSRCARIGTVAATGIILVVCVAFVLTAKHAPEAQNIYTVITPESRSRWAGPATHAGWFVNNARPPYIRSGGGCGICLDQRCSEGSPCATRFNFTDLSDSREYLDCRCACCGIQCLVGFNVLQARVGFSPSTYRGTFFNGCQIATRRRLAQRLNASSQ
mmetsp:Transcript_29027/g.78081  ORF Transcript_29027/g.78081 Transcript_29027/m.78081 type:complete len:159 (+) Transcript_29027:126-602(+)